MTNMNQLTALLTDITSSSTFTAEALAKFKAAIDKAAQLEGQLDEAIKHANYYKKLAEDYETKIKAFEGLQQVMDHREQALKTREDTMAELEKKLAVAEAKDGVRKEVFDTLFKNRTVREKMQDSVSGGANHNGISNSTYETHSVDRTTQEE